MSDTLRALQVGDMDKVLYHIKICIMQGLRVGKSHEKFLLVKITSSSNTSPCKNYIKI